MPTPLEPPTSELILVNLGTPTAPTPAAVRAFLAEFLGDPMVVEKPRWLWLPILHGIILRRRPAHVARAYAQIWSEAGSPLAAGTLALTEAVAHACPHVRVTHAWRYGSPNLAERLAESRAAFPGSSHPIHVVPLFPQRTASSSETIAALTAKLAREQGLESRLQLARLTPTAPEYIAALADGIEAARAELQAADPPPHLVVSFHGIPKAVDEREGARYTQDCRDTFDALVAATHTNPTRATLAYQSRFGRAPWIGPATDEALVALARAGTDSVVVATPGFLTAGLETIEELGIRARADFLAAGGRHFALAPTPTEPGPHAALVRELAALAP
jgi:ferrochelatase